VVNSRIVAAALAALFVTATTNTFAREGFGFGGGIRPIGGGARFGHPGYFRHRHIIPMIVSPYYGPTDPYFNSTYNSSDAVGYCMQRYRTYDPGTGAYVDADGLRHLCP